MPLLDHFRPPLGQQRHWHSFHHAWCTFLASHLNAQLPEGYFAESNVQFGIEIDVATFDNSQVIQESGWTAPAPTATLSVADIGDIVEVLIYRNSGGPTLTAAIELASPANKDRPAHRSAFVNKCASLLQQGIGLIIVDIVTERSGDLHGELLERLSAPAEEEHADLYAVGYRVVERLDQTNLDVWYHELQLGQSLPTLPLWLLGGLCLPVDLEATYERTRREQRVA